MRPAHTHTLACTFFQRCRSTHAYTCTRTVRCVRPQDWDQDGVDNETASDPVHLWSSVHYPNGHHSLLLITASSLSLLRCSCRFSSRYLSAHLHRSTDGFRGRWWDSKSEAAPCDYHHGDQPSTSLLDPENPQCPHWEWYTPPQTCTVCVQWMGVL